MKLKESLNEVEQFGIKTVVEHEMEIRKEDQHVILGIVSHKMYSNAIRTVIQEVGCNARDAQREYGNPDRPIRIKLPDSYDNSFYIQDFGVGISPDRMANVFVNYGASTKRSTNDETGGFGLGAKSPFSYTDQFGIVTVTPDENGKMILRQYMAIFEGKRRIVKLIEERSANVDEERGTKIVIPVKPEDFDKFYNWTIDRFRYWSVRPEIISKNKEVSWPENNVDFESEDGTWQVMKYEYKYGGPPKSPPQAVVDGIPYPISRASVERSNKNNDFDINKLWGYPVLIHFKTGEISMTATREELDYTIEETGNVIRAKFKEIIKDLKVKLNSKISNCKTFIDANTSWNEIKHEYNTIVSSVTWNGHSITGAGFNGGNGLCKIFSFTPNSVNTTGVSRFLCNHISFVKNMKVVIDKTDSKGIQTNKIARMFEDDSSLKFVYVIKVKKPEDIYSGHAIYKDVKDFDKKGTIKDVHDWLDKEYKINLYNPICIESLPKRKRKRKIKSANGVTKNNAEVIRKLDKIGWRSPFWNKTSLDYKNDTGYIVFLKNRNAYIDDNFSVPISNDTLKEIEENFDIDINGVLSTHAKKIGKNWTTLFDFMKSEYTKLKKEVDNMQVPDYYDNYNSSNVDKRIINIFNKLPKDCSLVKMINEWKNNSNSIVDYRKKAEKLNAVVKLLREIDPKNRLSYKGVDFASQKGVSSYADKIYKRYPFIFGTDSWNCKVSENDYIDYIKIMDKHYGPVA